MHLIPETSTLKWGCFSWIVPNLYHWEMVGIFNHMLYLVSRSVCFSHSCLGVSPEKQILKLTRFSGKPSWCHHGAIEKTLHFSRKHRRVPCTYHTVDGRNPKQPQPAGMVLKPCKSWDELPFAQLVIAEFVYFVWKQLFPSRKALESSQLKQPHFNWWTFRVPGYDIDIDMILIFMYYNYQSYHISFWKPRGAVNSSKGGASGAGSGWFWTSYERSTRGLVVKRWIVGEICFIPTWGNDPIWLIFFKWVETTN